MAASLSTMRHQRQRRASRTRTAFAVLLAILATAACSAPPEEDAQTVARKPKPVSGRVDTGTGISIELPDGWAEMSTEGRTYTKFYESKEDRLSIGLNDFPIRNESIWTLGEQVKRRLGNNGVIQESGPTTVDGRDGYRVVSRLKTETGEGIIIGTIVLRAPDRASTVFVFSTNDERPGDREKIDRIVSSLEVTS
jgi:hypothetical protein